jgi:hypothetical protein
MKARVAGVGVAAAGFGVRSVTLLILNSALDG